MGKMQILTYDDYAALSGDERFELLDGELISMAAAPHPRHQRILWMIARPFYACIDQAGGEAMVAPVDVILSPELVLQPDLIYLAPQSMGKLSRRGIEGAPDLCIEILSARTAERDRGVKSERYFQHGVREYWIVDPETQSIELYVPGDKAFQLHGAFTADAPVLSPLLPKLDLIAGSVFPA